MPAKRGRKPYSPSPAQRRAVAAAAAVGLSERIMADRLGIGITTLNKHFARELTMGRELLRAENAVRLWKAAKKGNVAAIIYLDKIITRTLKRQSCADE